MGAKARASAESLIGDVLCARVRELRRKRGWTLEELSAACGVSRSMLSEIERQRANPTLVVAYRIAQAFGMSLGELVETPGATHRIDVIRADDRTFHYRSDRYCRIRTLSPLHLEKSVEYYEIVLRPGGSLKSAAHFEGARELLTVQEGSARVRSAGDVAELHKGDSAHYPADVPHGIENVGEGEAVLFLVVTYSAGADSARKARHEGTKAQRHGGTKGGTRGEGSGQRREVPAVRDEPGREGRG